MQTKRSWRASSTTRACNKPTSSSSCFLSFAYCSHLFVFFFILPNLVAPVAFVCVCVCTYGPACLSVWWHSLNAAAFGCACAFLLFHIHAVPQCAAPPDASRPSTRSRASAIPPYRPSRPWWRQRPRQDCKNGRGTHCGSLMARFCLAAPLPTPPTCAAQLPASVFTTTKAAWPRSATSSRTPPAYRGPTPPRNAPPVYRRRRLDSQCHGRRRPAIPSPAHQSTPPPHLTHSLPLSRAVSA